MPSYRFETHFHTHKVSSCATVGAAEAVRWYHEIGYSGLVVTDHFHRGYFEGREALTADDPDDLKIWTEHVDAFLSGYETAKQAGEKLGMIVLPGMEIRFDENNNDYLVYGISREFLLAHPRPYTMTLRTFGPLAHRHGLRIYQAHPLRNTMTIMHPHLLDGMEAYNGNPRHDARNNLAALWADQHGLPAIAGSDFHKPGDQGTAGLDFQEPVCNNADLLKALAEQRYKLYMNGIAAAAGRS